MARTTYEVDTAWVGLPPSLRPVLLLLLAQGVAACSESRNNYADLALNNEERAKVAKLQTLFKSTRERIGSVYLAVEGTKVYRSREEHGAIVAWDLVQLPAQGYPSFLSTGGTMTVEALEGYLVFRLCEQAIGAGGGCQRGGLFRTQDGMTWECGSRSSSNSKNNNQESWATCAASPP